MTADEEEQDYSTPSDQLDADEAELDKSIFGGAPPEEPNAPLPVEQPISSPTAEQLYAPAQALADKPIPSDEELLTPQAPSKEPPKGVQWAGDAFTINQAPTAAPAGKEPPPPKGVEWAGDAFTLGEPSPEKPAEKRSIFMEPVVGAARGAAGAALDLVNVFNTVERKLGDWTGSDFFKNLAAADQELTDTIQKKAQTALAPSVAGLEEVIKDPSASNIARYGLGKFGEVLPMIAEYVYAGVPAMVIAGMMTGADKAARENNGDYGATLTGAAVGGVVAGARAPFLSGAAGKGLAENITRSMIGMPLITTAQVMAEPLPKAAATGKYEAPTWTQIAEGGITGGIGGFAGGVHGYYHAGGRTPEVPPVEGGTTGVDPDHQAALDEAAKAKGPQPDQLQIAPPLRQLPPPSLENRPPTPDVITGGPPPPTPTPPPAPRTPEQLAMDVELSPTRPAEQPAAPAAARPPEQLELPGGAPQQLGLPRAPEAPPAAAAPLEQPVQQRLPLDEPAARQGELPVTEPQQERLPLTGEQPYTGRPTAPLAPEPEPPPEPTRPPLGPTPQGEPGWIAERDDEGRGWVIKNADKHVIAVGDTAEQAMQFARARSRDQTAAAAESAARQAEAEATAARQPGRLVKGEAPAAETPTTVVEKPATVGEQLKAKQAAKAAPAEATEKSAPAQTKGEQLRAKRTAEKARLAETTTALRKKGQAFVSEGEPPPTKEELPAAKPEPRRSRMAEEARAEAEEQEVRHEPEGAAAEETVEPAEKTRSEKTTNLPRIAKDLLKGVLSAEPGDAIRKAVQAAHEAYGTEKPGRGSKRIYPEIVDYIEDRLKAATDETGTHVPKTEEIMTDTAIEQKARELQQRIKRRDPTLTPASKAAQEKAIYTAGERNREVRERADELRQMVDELRGGTEESKAADLETIMEKLRRQTGQLERGEELESPLSRITDRLKSRTEGIRRLFRAPEINRPLQDMLRRDGRGGLGSSVHDYLDAIINNSMSRSVIPHAVELARQLKRILPPETRVMTRDTAVELFGLEPKPSAAGSYIHALDLITVNKRLATDELHDYTNATVTALHEALHGGTAHYIDRLLEGAQDGTLDHVEKRHLQAFRAIDKAVQEIRANPPRRLTEYEQVSLKYANKNLHELTTMLMTDPNVHDVVRNVSASPAFRRDMNRLGYGLKPTNSLWDGFKAAMSRVLRLSGGTANGDFFDHVMSPMTDIIEAAGAHRAGREAEIRGEAEENQAVAMIRKMAADEGITPSAVIDRAVARRGEAASPLDQIPDARQREAVRPLTEHLEELDAPLRERGKGALDRFWTNTLRHVDGAMVRRGVRKSALLAAPRNAVVSHNEDIFRSRDPDAPGAKPLEDWRTADQAVWRATQHEQETYADRINNLVRRMVGPERMTIAQLMNDVGYAKVHLGEKDVAADNPHIAAGSDQAKEMHRLNGVYNSLTAAGQETYKGYKQYYRETYAKERKAEFEGIVRKAMPDQTPAEQKALAAQMTTLKKINELIRAPDSTAVADEYMKKTDPNLTPELRAAAAERWQHNRAMVREIAKAQRAGFVEGDYFPQKRYGDYVVTYGKKGVKTGPDAYGVEMFETSSAAAARRDELRTESDKLPEAQKFDVSEPFLKSATDTVRSSIPREMIDQLDAAIKQKGLSTDQAKIVQDAMLGLMLKNGTNQAAFRVRRAGIKGAGLEPERTLVRDYLAYTSRMGHLEHGGERATAMQEMERHLRRMREQGDGRVTTHVQAAAAQTELARLRQAKVAENDPRMMAQREILNRPAPPAEGDRARDVIDSLKQRSAPVDGDMSSSIVGRMARGFNTISAVYQLLRPAHLAVQIIDTHAKAESYIGARHGFGAAALALAKAVKDLAPRAAMTGGKAMYRAVRGELKVADWDMTALSRDRLTAANPKDKAGINQLMDALDATGTLTHTRAREMQRLSRPGAFNFPGVGPLSKLPGNLMNMMAVAEHTMDHMNRVAVAKAAYDLELRRFGNVDQAVKYGVAEALKAQPDYTPANKPPIAMQSGKLGTLAAPAMLYKLYGMHTYSVMANLVKNAATGAERAEARKALAATLAIHSMLIGVLPSLFGVPVNGVLGAWDWISGKDEPHDYESDMMNSVSDLFGPTAARFAARGLLGMAGVDLHRSLKLSNMTDITGPKTFDAKGVGGAVLTALTGASGSQGYQFADAFHNLFSGNYGKALTQFLPRVARDAVQGYGAATEGIKDPRGKSIILQKDISPVDVGLKVLGFNPSTWAAQQDKRAKVAEYKREQDADQKHAEDAYTRAYQAHDMSTAFKVLKAYNDMYPEARITSAEMATKMKGIAKASNDPRFGGLNIPKKQQAEALRAVRGFGP